MSILQYLVYEDKPGSYLSWEPNGQQPGIPQGAVLGGHDEDGSPLYIIRFKRRVGFHDPRETQAEYGKARDRNALHTIQWDYLVITYCEFVVR